ncbi:hypothetical protein SNEBB_008397 [Seison nebaliae]|nr:hypothetical protein SNEBB_008397 [Seison nebaliae]
MFQTFPHFFVGQLECGQVSVDVLDNGVHIKLINNKNCSEQVPLPELWKKSENLFVIPFESLCILAMSSDLEQFPKIPCIYMNAILSERDNVESFTSTLSCFADAEENDSEEGMDSDSVDERPSSEVERNDVELRICSSSITQLKELYVNCHKQQQISNNEQMEENKMSEDFMIPSNTSNELEEKFSIEEMMEDAYEDDERGDMDKEFIIK